MGHKRIVVIGAGIVGCSIAYYLSKMGQRNITVIEQGPLFETGGSTSHAPGLVFQLSFSKILTTLASQTVETFKELSTDEQRSFYPVGSLEVARTPERLEDLKRKAGVASSWGIEAFLLSPQECAEKNSLICPERICGGLYVPSDGIAKPLHAVDKMTRFSKECGVEFYGHTEVKNIEVTNGQVKAVYTSAGKFEADVIVCCAGFWGPRIGEMVGVTIPLQPMAHQYVFTNDLLELNGETEEAATPLIRDQDNAIYFRQVEKGLGIGSYQHKPFPVELSDITKYGETKEMPSVKPFTPKDFEKPWEDAMELIPALKRAGIKKGMNGIFSFTPDGMPLLGESQAVGGFWVAEAIWVTHSAGVARQMAEWLMNGAPTVDLELCDINRFDTYACSPVYYKQRSIEEYEEVYSIHHPFMQRKVSRNMRVSPFYMRQQELEAYFNEKAGWEQPQWYEANYPLISTYEKRMVIRKGWSAEYWSPIIEAEQLHTRQYAAIYDTTAAKKRLEIKGEGALQFLQKLTTGNIDITVGQSIRTCMLHERGGIKDQITVIRKNISTFLIVCTGAVEASWIQKHVPQNGQVVFQDVTSGTCSIALIGPKATGVMKSVVQCSELSSTWIEGQAKTLFIEKSSVLALRDSYGGMESWELITTSDQGLNLWDVLIEQGQPYQLIAAGDRALENLRIESFSLKSGKDFWSEHHPYEVNLHEMVDLTKPVFIGKEALLDRQRKDSDTVLATLILDDPSAIVMGYEPVFYGETALGFVTSAGYSYSLGKGIVHTLLSQAVHEEMVLEVEYFGQRYKATMMTHSPAVV
ncbi:FAD-dependent oxidoreductase [Priestia megaterium]|uniref:GcvT family protein n=1 Tax=Priestia megaterium TaxID=1404 RepID=UPI003012B2C2